MKTKKLILLTIGLLLCATQGFATQYCHTSISNGSKSILMTCSPTGNTNEFQLLFEGTEDVKITGINNANVGINNINGQVGGVPLSFDYSSDNNGSAKATFTKVGTPDAPYVAYMAFATNDGEVVFSSFPTDMDWTTTCSGGGGDTEAPVMTSASVTSTTHNSAVVTVAATDKVGVTAYVVKNGGEEVGTYTPSNNTITITGFSASSTYNYTVYAKDAAGNVSASGINISITTTAAPAAPVYQESGTISGSSEQYIYTVRYNSNKTLTITLTLSQALPGQAVPEFYTTASDHQNMSAWDNLTSTYTTTVSYDEDANTSLWKLRIPYSGAAAEISMSNYKVGADNTNCGTCFQVTF